MLKKDQSRVFGFGSDKIKQGGQRRHVEGTPLADVLHGDVGVTAHFQSVPGRSGFDSRTSPRAAAL